MVSSPRCAAVCDVDGSARPAPIALTAALKSPVQYLAHSRQRQAPDPASTFSGLLCALRPHSGVASRTKKTVSGVAIDSTAQHSVTREHAFEEKTVGQ